MSPYRNILYKCLCGSSQQLRPGVDIKPILVCSVLFAGLLLLTSTGFAAGDPPQPSKTPPSAQNVAGDTTKSPGDTLQPPKTPPSPPPVPGDTVQPAKTPGDTVQTPKTPPGPVKTPGDTVQTPKTPPGPTKPAGDTTKAGKAPNNSLKNAADSLKAGKGPHGKPPDDDDKPHAGKVAKSADIPRGDDPRFPKMVIGVVGGWFQAAKFDSVFGVRHGLVYGGEYSLAIRWLGKDSRLYATVQYHSFDKAQTSDHTDSLKQKATASWNHQILNLGIRWAEYSSSEDVRGGLGFGVAMVSVSGSLGNSLSYRKSAQGFYGEIFAAAAWSRRLEMILNIKYDMAKFAAPNWGPVKTTLIPKIKATTISVNAGIAIRLL